MKAGMQGAVFAFLAGLVAVMPICRAVFPPLEVLEIWRAWSEMGVRVCLSAALLLVQPDSSGLLIARPTTAASATSCVTVALVTAATTVAVPGSLSVSLLTAGRGGYCC